MPMIRQGWCLHRELIGGSFGLTSIAISAPSTSIAKGTTDQFWSTAILVAMSSPLPPRYVLIFKTLSLTLSAEFTLVSHPQASPSASLLGLRPRTKRSTIVKKNCLVLSLSVALGCAMARADVIDIAFDHSSETGSPGDTLRFFGTLTNPGSDTVFLNSDSLNLSGFPLSSITDLFANTPLSLAGGAHTGDIELFDVAIPSVLPEQ
ncbi:MAG: hypothetical protein ABSE86_00540 [Bryobacteraceae bacterium]|jgi:hypothetical protein